jgi:hypothetical protein
MIRARSDRRDAGYADSLGMAVCSRRRPLPDVAGLTRHGELVCTRFKSSAGAHINDLAWSRGIGHVIACTTGVAAYDLADVGASLISGHAKKNLRPTEFRHMPLEKNGGCCRVVWRYWINAVGKAIRLMRSAAVARAC